VLIAWDFGGRRGALTGSQFCLDPGTGLDTRLAGGTVFNGELTRPWRIGSSARGLFSTLETRLTVQNAGDLALYDQCGLPQAGRVLGFQVRVF
jgi:iron complex outermembrane receptor protein